MATGPDESAKNERKGNAIYLQRHGWSPGVLRQNGRRQAINPRSVDRAKVESAMKVVGEVVQSLDDVQMMLARKVNELGLDWAVQAANESKASSKN